MIVGALLFVPRVAIAVVALAMIAVCWPILWWLDGVAR